MSGASKKVIIVESDGGGASQKVSADNALLVGGTASTGRVPIVQADESVEWGDPAAGSSKWEADGENEIKPTEDKTVSMDNMTETDNAKIMTAAERTAIGNNSGARHTQGTDLGLDTGGDHPVTAETIKGHIDDTTIVHVATGEKDTWNEKTTLVDVKDDTDIADAITKKHEHTNKVTLDKITESEGNPLWDGNEWPGGGDGDVTGPATNTDNYVPQWDGDNSNALKNGLGVGTAANNLVQLDGDAKLPAVDGSNLTNVSSGESGVAATKYLAWSIFGGA